ncbi:PID-CTERM protein-sorting domain-containing protein [Mariniflexile ostreae]|uniref:PID-CTERM protein-sorting domain-containing protein n=1 Tax=Mariniflexile ostreae TaxID=1520892 RepID=A0ABV5FBW5_9FLAO
MQNKKLIAAILVVLVSCVSAYAQGPPVPAPPPPPGLPIDGGVWVGVFVALVYGVKKCLKKNVL